VTESTKRKKLDFNKLLFSNLKDGQLTTNGMRPDENGDYSQYSFIAVIGFKRP